MDYIQSPIMPPILYIMSIIYGFILDYGQENDYNFSGVEKKICQKCLV